MNKTLLVLLLLANTAFAQKNKAEQKTLESIKTSVKYLASDQLEGRRTGTPGEKLAYEYIIKQFKKAGLKPSGENGSYLQAFEVNDGKSLTASTSFFINGTALTLNEEWFPLSYSANKPYKVTLSKTARIPMKASFTDLGTVLEENKDNPHFDLDTYLLNMLKAATEGDTEAVILFNSSGKDDGLKYDAKSKAAAYAIPVVYVKWPAYKKWMVDNTDDKEISINVASEEKKRTGHNVVGFVNNNAAQTIVLGAHYDHLGYGEDKNSLYAGSGRMVHNGADDNASGTAALIELAKWAKTTTNKKYNYLFVSFSGEELGLYGSKYFVDKPPVDLKNINYMINMDMVGRLNDSTHGLTVGGYGTSPVWGEIIKTDNKYFKIKVDSAGSGPSDHTSFYRKDIPVLFFFTGTHSDYHKPSDDYEKINYNGELAVINYVKEIIGATNNRTKLTFTKTKEPVMSKSSFKVTMGILLDYTYSGNGVLAEGVSENRPAFKAGVKPGDVIVQLGDHKVTDVQTYMGALNKFNKGDSTKVKLLRGKEEIILDITF